MDNASIKDLWEEVVKLVNSQLPRKILSLFTFISPELTSDGKTLILKSRVSETVIKRNHNDDKTCIENAVKEVFGPETKIEFAFEIENKKSQKPHAQNQMALPVSPPLRTNNGSRFGRLDPDLTFEKFAVGPSNKFVFTLSSLFAEDKMAGGNKILLLVGDVGTGKTHLAQAVCHRLANKSEKPYIIYLEVDRFVDLFVGAAREKNSSELKKLREAMSNCDIFVLDGIHLLEEKEKSQSFLLSILKSREDDSGKKFVATSLASPEQIKRFSEELRSRITGGLRWEISPPDRETKGKIITFWAKSLGLSLDEDAINRLKEIPTADIRKMSGILKNIEMQKAINPDTSIDKIANTVFSLYFRPGNVALDHILRVVCDYFKVDLGSIPSKSRKKNIARPRQICCYLARQLTDKSLEDIGKKVNRRHSTILYDCEKIKRRMNSDSQFKSVVNFLEEKIRAMP